MRWVRTNQRETDAHHFYARRPPCAANVVLMRATSNAHSQGGRFADVRRVGPLKITRRGGYSKITVQELADYERVVVK